MKFMKNNITIFEKIKTTDENNNEFWEARKLAKALEYKDFRNFSSVIEKAKKACENSKQRASVHFVDFTEMVEIGLGVSREIKNFRLSRYACYLIVQNADPAKEVIALGQSYFAMQTRLQEISQMHEYQKLTSEEEKRLYLRNELKTHNIQLASVAKQAGVISSLDYAIFKNHGYIGLYGGLDAKKLHKKRKLKKSQNILDHMGSTELAANLFRATQAEEKLKKDKIKGVKNANQTHLEIGKKVRQTIAEIGGTMPENLPIADNIKTVENKKKKKLNLLGNINKN